MLPAGKYVVGYHYDAQSLDPSGWLTGSAWDWTSVYESITKVALGGSFKGSPYNANWVGSFADNDNPLVPLVAPTSPDERLARGPENALAVASRVGT